MSDSTTAPTNNDLLSEDVQNILRGIQIPPRPQLLNDVDREFKKENPNITVIAGLITRDVSLTAAVLKTVNSPFFSLTKKITSIPYAIQVIGLKNIKCLITGLVLKQTTSNAGKTFERFWDSSEKVASISARIAGMLPRVPKDTAYTFGLFREIGIPLMMQRFPDYRETLQLAISANTPMTEVEESRYSTNHAIIGRMVARTWLLPDEITEGILLHHDPAVLHSADGISSPAKTLVMINYLAEYLHEKTFRMRDDAQWHQNEETVLDYLGISHTEVVDLQEHISEE